MRFFLIYYKTLNADIPLEMHTMFISPLYTLLINCLITIFFGGFLAYLQFDQERNRVHIKTLQEQKINELDDIVKKRTQELHSMRENIATDFHDETGNMLSAITRQASLLKFKTQQIDDLQVIVESIILNSNRLYSSSKDFLWHLNHNSDDAQELFDYLTAYGQSYYNQFDIAFSAMSAGYQPKLLQPSAALKIIYIFKEAMTNSVKHSGAREVTFEMDITMENIIYALQDNGQWRPENPIQQHYGLVNIQKRCDRNGFEKKMIKKIDGTRLEISISASHTI